MCIRQAGIGIVEACRALPCSLALGLGSGLLLNLDYFNCFGDAANMAFKLAEDVAVSGEFLIMADLRERIESCASLPASLELEPRSALCSNVRMEHLSVTWASGVKQPVDKIGDARMALSGVMLAASLSSKIDTITAVPDAAIVTGVARQTSKLKRMARQAKLRRQQNAKVVPAPASGPVSRRIETKAGGGGLQSVKC